VLVARISSPLFVGRSAELTAIDAVLNRARDGHGSAVLVVGEAGIGKSRLIAEVESRARAAGVAVLAGDCVALADGELAFAPIIAALRPVMVDSQLLTGLGPVLRYALGALWPFAGSDSPHSADREQLFEAVYRVLAGLTLRQPVLLIIEDVHWIDPSSRDLLAFIVHNARRDRLVVVVSYRPDELGRGHPLRPFVAELERSGRAERLDLTGLGRSDVAQQAAAITGQRLPARATETIFTRSDGNPFFVEELLAASSGAGGLPSSLREALLLRVQSLSPDARDVLRVAAAIGRTVDHRLLACVAGREPVAELREATEQHVLVATAPGPAYTFRHTLLREAIYEDTQPGQRLALHRAIAETLTAQPALAGADGGAAAELAHHWYSAGEPAAALGASVEAAARAARIHAHPEALGHLERALELWEQVPDAEKLAGGDRVELLLRASDWAEHAGSDERNLEYALRAREAVDDRIEPTRAADAEQRIGRALWNAGRADDALEHLERAVGLIPDEPPSAQRAYVSAAYGRLLMLNGAFAQARGPLEEALQLSQALAEPSAQVSVLNSLAIVYDQLGERRRAIAAGRDGLRLATELSDGAEMLRSYINGSTAVDNDGRLEEALALSLEGVAVAHRLGLDRAAGDQLSFQAAWRLIRLGRFAEAQRVIAPAFENATLVFNIAATRNVAGYLAGVRGEFDQADALLEEAWELMQHTGGFHVIGLAMAWRIALCLWRGELERAHVLAHDGMERVTRAEGQLLYTADLYWLAARAEADRAETARAQGHTVTANESSREAAATASALARAIADALGGEAPPEARAFAILVDAERARAQGSYDPLEWEAAAERLGELGRPYPVAYAKMREAESLALGGAAPAEVARPLRSAFAAALELGVTPFRCELEALARRAGISLAEPVRRSAAQDLGLTERELTVLALIADGRTNPQIGEELFISTKTASAHVAHILMKLGVANRAQAAAAAHRLGLIVEAPAPEPVMPPNHV
jgi:ATP/maltotriose-dependent transcriptional regulator MalT